MNRITPCATLSLPYLRHSLSLMLLLAVASTSWAQTGDTLQGFHDTGLYRISVDGEDDPKAQVYLSQSAGAYLILSPSFSNAVVIRPRYGVSSVPYLKMTQQANGTIDITGASGLRRIGNFDMKPNQVIAFAVDGREVELWPNPPLTGSRVMSELLDHSPQYGYAARSYTPDAATLEELRSQSQDVQVRVFFGSWCHVCKNYLPNHLKVEQSLQDSKIRFEYFGLRSPPDGWKDPLVKRLKVESLPTAIVYVDGKEKGRFVGSQGFGRPEKSLVEVLR